MSTWTDKQQEGRHKQAGRNKSPERGLWRVKTVLSDQIMSFSWSNPPAGVPTALRKRSKLCPHGDGAPRETPHPHTSPLLYLSLMFQPHPPSSAAQQNIRLLPTSGPLHLPFPLPGNALPQLFVLSPSFSPKAVPHTILTALGFASFIALTLVWS